MAEWIAQGWVVPVILGLMGLEWVILALLYARRRAGLGPMEVAANLFAGGGLLLAVRAGLMDQPLEAALWLALAGFGHGIDLMMRLRRN
jgi:hypothetical protein